MKEAIYFVGLYICSVLTIAIPLAIFEVWLEKFKSGWGGEFYNPFWGYKIRLGFLNKIAEKTYISVYHAVMFGLVIPALLFGEYLLLRYLSEDGSWMLEVYGVRIIPIIFLPTVWLGNTFTEDFLYFVFNWRWPSALKRFFNGEMEWHTHYVDFGSFKLPRFYITYAIVVVVLLVAQCVLVRII